MVRGHMQDFAAAVLKHRTLAELREVCLLRGVSCHGSKEDMLNMLLTIVRGGSRESHQLSPGSSSSELEATKRPAADMSTIQSAESLTPKRRRRSMSKVHDSPFGCAQPMQDVANAIDVFSTSSAMCCSTASSKEPAPRRRRSMSKTSENIVTDCSLPIVQETHRQALASSVGEAAAAATPKRRQSFSKVCESTCKVTKTASGVTSCSVVPQRRSLGC